MNTSTTQPPAPQLALIALSPCICGAPVDQDECPYPAGPLIIDGRRQLYKVTCTARDCGWSAIGYGADGARKAWNTRPQSRPEAELPELPEADGFIKRSSAENSHNRSEPYYFASKVRAYGQQCAATRLPEVDPSMEPFCVDDERATAGKGDRSDD